MKEIEAKDKTSYSHRFRSPINAQDAVWLLNLMEELNINLDLIKAIESDNSKFRKTVFNGMRGEE